MDELDESRGIDMLFALMSAGARRQEHEQGAQALSTRIYNVIRDPVDERNLAVQTMFDDPVHGLKIGGYELTNLF
jgi:hypothetical protein